MSDKILGDDVFVVRHEIACESHERWPQWQRYDCFNTLVEAVAGAAQCLHDRFEAVGDGCGGVEIVGYPSGHRVDVREFEKMMVEFWVGGSDDSDVDFGKYQ